MSEFVFLFRGGMANGSPEQMQQQMQKWMNWIKKLGDDGVLANPGQPLERGGKVVRGTDKTVTDGPYAEAKDLVGGFMLISAPDLDRAADISKGCPVFDVGGSVEIRPVMKLSM